VHLKETEGQVRRLEQIFEMVGEKPEGIPARLFRASSRRGRRSCRSSRMVRLWMLV
jgi:hypothetical protein